MVRLIVLVALLLSVSTPASAQAGGAQPDEAERLDVAHNGIAARYYVPVDRPPGVAVLLLGGSDCGYPSARAARDLAGAGYAVLALAYCSGFNGPIEGLPASLANIPLEYVDRGFDWLRGRIGSGIPIVMIGESRGAELALFYAATRSDVDGVIAFSPSSLLWGAVGDATGTVPAWTRDGIPLPRVTRPLGAAAGPQPFQAILDEPELVRAAAIPVERIAGPILLVSSRADNIWPAARMADQIEQRLRRNGFRHALSNLQFDDASHLLMGPGPGRVTFRHGDFSIHFGGSEQGTLAARTSAWEAAKTFLEHLDRGDRVPAGSGDTAGSRNFGDAILNSRAAGAYAASRSCGDTILNSPQRHPLSASVRAWRA
ncbi:acyl-CoA thioester hydrolase/BAAT C-terminal domain-containing protein [Sphingosinicella terrae]|uniref:acyl-CoA thioester hydrolase/BAAT C-terminal domain-containing protein n=1 Tax=Sphingosinicella terrae TaxID=2172047 RepID=UPI000E0CEF24|nr:acyl-CoA thioester hydrolase/BAAT C-terminal domain-containing protein [Sphingosinicella terrae]